MSKQKSTPLKRAASLSSSLLRIGGAARDSGPPRPRTTARPIASPGPDEGSEPSAIPAALVRPKPPAQEPKPAVKLPPAEAPERPRARVAELETEAFDGMLPGLLTSESKAAPAEKTPAEPSPPPRLLDQFECLQSRNQELALKEADRSSATPASFLRNLRGGRFAEAESDFGQIMQLEPKLAKKILDSAELEDLAIICRAIGFKPLEFATIIALLRGAKAKKRGLSATDQLKASLGIFESIDHECALGLLEHIPWLPQRDWSSLKGA